MKKYVISLAVLGLVGFGVYQKVYIPKHTFKIVTPKVSNMAVVVNGVGNIGSENIYKVSALYGGKICDFNISLGEFVKKGQIIAKIDSVDLEDKLKELQANLKVINDNINSTKLDKDSAYKQYIYQEEVLRKNQKLYKRRAISELEYKKYKTDRDVAKLKVKSLESKLQSLKNQIPQIQASISGLEERLKRYTLFAPIDGYVTKKYISNNDIIGNNQPLIEIVNPKDVWIDTFIDTRISGDLKVNNKTSINLRSGLKTKGYVYKINPLNNSVTNEREIFIKFNQVPIPFYINEQAIVDIKLKTLKNVTIIPSKAIVIQKEKYGVWVLKDNKAHFEPIKILAHHNKIVAIQSIKGKIVIPNPKKKTLSEGMKIYHD